MKIFLSNIFIFFVVLFRVQSKITQKPHKQTQIKNQQKIYRNSPKDRQLSFSPYLNSFEDYSAKKIGDQDQGDSQPYLGAIPVGQKPDNMSTIIPTTFSGGSTLPGSQMYPMNFINASHNPITTALFNPLGNNPVLSAGNTSLNMSGQAIRYASGFATQIFAPPVIKVQEQCSSVLKQAVKIAQTVMESQFEQMSQFITKYLSFSRYSSEMNELQLSRQLRQDMYKHMMDYSNLTAKNIVFGPSNGKYDVSEDMLIKNLKKMQGEDVNFERPNVNNFVAKI